MERRIESDVEGWPTRPFEDGYEGLRQLASADFSGVVRASGTWLFFVNGKIVGVFEGSLEDVEAAQGTAHKAPHPSLPLLYAMQATGGDTRAKYYTNDTPISEVDDTLSSGSFTGYVELGENVLSGDYYQLYHGGRSMSVAFVGNSGKMITGDDAFERADDEVGIYEIVDVDVEVTEVPRQESGASESETDKRSTRSDAEGSDADAAVGEAAVAANGEAEDAGSIDDASESDASGSSAGGSDTSSSDARDAQAEANPTASAGENGRASGSTSRAANEDGSPTDGGSETDDDAPIEAGPVPDASTADAENPGAEPDADAATAAESNPTPRDHSSADAAAADPSATDGAGTGAADPIPEPARETSDSTPRSGQSGAESSDRTDSPRQSEAAWQEATTVPSLDPDRSEDEAPNAQSPPESGGRRRSRSKQQSRQQQSKQSGRRSADPSRSSAQQHGNASERSTGQRSTSGGSSGVDNTLEQEVLEREDRLDRLQQRVENLQDERDELAEERAELEERVESLTDENESLRGEIRELEQEVEELEAAAGGAGSGTGSGAGGSGGAAGAGAMAPRAALEGTDLFVRYDSKSAPTLEAAHDGSADGTAVNENLRLDVHTQFEDEGVTVDDEPFEDFLRETMAYRFVEWLVRDLPYEIRETDSASALRDLYDAIPEIDRVEFHGEVARDAVEDEEGAPSETFDVVVRDKMGEALLVANMNDARDPATGRMIVDLQEAASRVKEHQMALSGAFFVTRSFFEPAALETTSEATSGSLLSRDSRASYVKLSRKQGYHLCLVEARGQDLHLNVPEL